MLEFFFPQIFPICSWLSIDIEPVEMEDWLCILSVHLLVSPFLLFLFSVDNKLHESKHQA